MVDDSCLHASTHAKQKDGEFSLTDASLLNALSWSTRHHVRDTHSKPLFSAGRYVVGYSLYAYFCACASHSSRLGQSASRCGPASSYSVQGSSNTGQILCASCAASLTKSAQPSMALCRDEAHHLCASVATRHTCCVRRHVTASQATTWKSLAQ